MISRYISPKKKSDLDKFLRANLTYTRRVHTSGVMESARLLAIHWHVDSDKAHIAALCHDMMRRKGDENNLTHGPEAAEIMALEFGITDIDILNAVRFHTTGRANMSTLEKIIYLADAVEPNRKYPGVKNNRNLAFNDLEKACIQSLTGTKNYLVKNNLYLDPNTDSAILSLNKEIESRE